MGSAASGVDPSIAGARVVVVMPAHNAAATIGRAIKSLQAQTYRDWQLLVVDDGSTDGTMSVVDAVDDERVHVLPLSERRGAGAARNAAFNLVDNEFVALLDADDECMPERFAVQVAYLDENPEVDVVGSGAVVVDSKGATIGLAIPPRHHAELAASMFKSTPLLNPSVLMRRSFVERSGGYRVVPRRAQDTDMWLRTYQTSVFANVAEPLIRYTQRDTTPLRDVAAAGYVIFRNAIRQRRFLGALWFPVRPLLAKGYRQLRGLRAVPWE